MPAARVLLATTLLALVGCGYLASGEWEDDPGNWERAFGREPPPGLHVVRSRYRRSPHFTHEYAYHFELAPSADVERRLLESYPTRRLTGSEAEAAVSALGERPEWFAPRPSSAYEVWTYADDPSCGFRLLIDVETRALFLTDEQR